MDTDKHLLIKDLNSLRLRTLFHLKLSWLPPKAQSTDADSALIVPDSPDMRSLEILEQATGDLFKQQDSCALSKIQQEIIDSLVQESVSEGLLQPSEACKLMESLSYSIIIIIIIKARVTTFELLQADMQEHSRTYTLDFLRKHRRRFSASFCIGGGR